MKKVKNGLLGITEKIAELQQQSQLYKAPLQNMESADYNLREQLYTFRWTQLSYRYATDGIFRTLIQQPVLDALRNGIKIKSDLLSQDDLQKLENNINKKNIIKEVKELFIWNRLFGGAGLIVEQANQDLKEPFSINSVNLGDNINYYSCHRWELANSQINISSKIQENELAKTTDEYFYYYGDMINKDRMFILDGVSAPRYIKLMLQGWGLSVAEPLIAPSNIYQKTMNLCYELIDQSKIDVYSIEGLKESAGAGQDRVVIDQIQLTNILKNFLNAIVLDKNDTYEQRQLNLSGIVDILHELKLDICSAVKIPAVVLWGMSPSGFSSGEFDLKSYYSNIESEVRPEIKSILLRILKIECKSLFGFIPDDIDFEFENLLIKTEDQVQNYKDKEFNRLLQLYNNKLLTKKEFFDALQTQEVLSIKTKASELDEYTEGEPNTDKLSFGNNENTQTD